MDALVLLGSFALMLALGVPVAYALGLAALVGACWIDIPLDALVIQLAAGVNKFSLLAIPFFVLAGAIMAEGGMARRLVAFAAVLVGFIRGGLSLVNILASTFFGAISGSSVADTASVGSVLIPEMEKKGYPRDFATAVTVSGSVQAILIPPSHNAVIYSLAAGGTVSIAHLLIAGVLPGLLLGGALMVMCIATAYRRGYPKEEVVPLRQALKLTAEALWGLMTMVLIMGGILSGVFTATESASVACLYAFLVTMLVYRDYRWRDLPRLVHRVVKTVATVMILIGFAAAFGYVMTLMQLPAKMTALFVSLSNDRVAILLMINTMLLFLGTLMDMAPLILICTPILLPVVKNLGIDPVHFGMIMLTNLGIGLITPPVGSVLFVGSAVSKLSIERVTRTLLPFYVVLVLVLMLITYVPWFSLWLPRAMGLQ
jgi:tripartite ATP-independent transporter DctM subunit